MADEIDRANDLAEHALERALNAQRKRAATDLRQPTDLVGVCTDCGEPIDQARMHALPEACRCVGCQTAHEKEAM